METKRNQGPDSCYSKAHPDEPMFVLLGRDPYAPILVGLWAEMRRMRGCSTEEELADAEATAEALKAWATQLGKEEKINGAVDDMIAVMRRTMKTVEHIERMALLAGAEE